MNTSAATLPTDGEQLYDYATHLLLEEQRSVYEVRQALVQRGLDPDRAENLLFTIEDQLQLAEKQRAQRNILYGSLWLVGGVIATAIGGHWVFAGGILVGLVLFGRGVRGMG